MSKPTRIGLANRVSSFDPSTGVGGVDPAMVGAIGKGETNPDGAVSVVVTGQSTAYWLPVGGVAVPETEIDFTGAAIINNGHIGGIT